MTGFFDKLDQLEAIIAGPELAAEKLRLATPLLADSDVRREFWNLLDDEAWVEPLKAAGYFDNPTPVEHVAGGGVRFPSWGPSKYLARIAARAPVEAATILAALDTDNVSVIGDLLDAARHMPLEQAAALVPTVGKAARAKRLWIHFKDATRLCVRLAEAGQVDNALTLADALFTPTGDPENGTPIERDTHWYKEGLRSVTPPLAKRDAHRFVPMLCEWLDKVVRATKRVNEDSGDDYSYIWRPAIEDHEQNRDYDLAAVLVGCTRMGLEIGIREGGLTLAWTLDQLAQRKPLVFARLSLHLLSEFGGQDLPRVEATILDRAFFEDHRLKHEYARLVAHHIGHLNQTSREQWYTWIDDGPDMSDFDEHVRKHLERTPTDEDRLARISYWKFERLHWIRESLSGDRKNFYEQMLAEQGTPEMADLTFRVSGGWIGEQSPVSIEELASLTPEEVIEVVSTWKPGEGARGPNIEGLLATLGKCISRKPDDFSRRAESLKGRPLPVVSVYLRQMTVAVKEGREIDLKAVVNLCISLLSNSELDDEVSRPIEDEIAEVVSAACQATREQRPHYPLEVFRKPFLLLLNALLTSPSPPMSDKRSGDLRLQDYLDVAINSPRGKATGATMDFAHWLALHITASNPKSEAVPGGMAALPEVRELLERIIAPENRSLESMAALGARVGVINWIDASWLRDNADRIFVLEQIETVPTEAFGWAAWNAFLVWVAPHVAFYRAFGSQFNYAVRQAALVDIEQRDHYQPMFRLGEHLMVLYGRGQLVQGDNIVWTFLDSANPSIRRHAIGFVGSSFGRGDAPKDVLDRFMRLWETYWTGAGQRDASEDPEAVIFGSWFASGEFPDQWSIGQLEDFVNIVSVPEPDHAVLEKLADIGLADIERAVRIVRRMVEADHENWKIAGWKDDVMTILEHAVTAGGDAERAAEEVIETLGRRGFVTFGELLRH